MAWKGNRRRWLGLTLGSGAAIGAYTWGIEPRWVEIVRRPLPIHNLPKAWSGRTIVQLSDLHLGTTVDDDYLRHCFDLVRRLRPDLVVFTGDFVTKTKARTMSPERLHRVYSAAPLGRLGSLAILGNHDYGLRYRDADFAAGFSRRLSGYGVRVLRNEQVSIQGLSFVGLDDYWGTNFQPRGVAPTEPDVPAVVLCHNPDVADLPIWERFNGWMLSGHTHGGQCRAPFFGPPWLPVVNARYVAGEYAVGNGRRLYINRGVGHLIPVRFCVRPEITVFTAVADG